MSRMRLGRAQARRSETTAGFGACANAGSRANSDACANFGATAAGRPRYDSFSVSAGWIPPRIDPFETCVAAVLPHDTVL